MTRAVVDLDTLDQLIRDELAKVERASDFGFAVWRQEPDESGANWNAYLRRCRGNDSADTRWWDVVPRLRAAYSLNDEKG
jgi:hypothetical protein